LVETIPRVDDRIALPDGRWLAFAEFGADLAGTGRLGVVDDERLMPLPWGFEPEQVESPVRLWLGKHDKLVPPRLWLERAGSFPVSETTVVPGAGHFLIAECMTEIGGTV
jgi:pimeloyl-ACP methyl ester carboxylesterase